MAIDPLNLAALDLAQGLDSTPKSLDRVAKETSLDAARWAFTQWELRRRAASKFDRADQMLFTREALEQSTHERVAQFRASRFPNGASVADLTCGIGGDLISLAARGHAIGFDLDSERLDYARWNLEIHGLEADLRLQDSNQATWDFEFAIADPSRRVSGRRTLNPDDFEPNPTALAERMLKLKLGCLKLSPMLRDDFLESLGGGLEFWSFGGECREAAVWLGGESEPGRRAIHLGSGLILDSNEPAPNCDLGDYFFEADPAAIRAHCLGTLCERHGLVAVGDSNGYLSGSSPIDSPWLKGYRVIEELPRDHNAAKRRLAVFDAKTPIVKSRAKAIDRAAMAKKWKLSGKSEFVVAAFPDSKSIRFMLLEPLGSSR